MIKKHISTVIVLFVLIAAGIAFSLYFNFSNAKKVKKINVYGAVGGGKENLLADADVLAILSDRYGLTLSADPWSNNKLIKDPLTFNNGKSTYDFAFFSDERFYEYYKTPAGAGEAERLKLKKYYVSIKTPVVIYSWAEATDILVDIGIVEQRSGVYYITDMPALIDLMLQRKKWKDLGHSVAFDKVTILSPNPLISSPGTTYYGLLASTLAGENLNHKNINAVLPKIKGVYNLIGTFVNTPSDLFDAYINYGSAGYQLVADYEKSIIEFAQENPGLYASVKDEIRVLYPSPTIWNSHCLMSFSPNGDLFLDAFSDPEIADIAWTRYGFRTTMASSKGSGLQGIAASIDFASVMPLDKQIADRIIEYLSSDESSAFIYQAPEDVQSGAPADGGLSVVISGIPLYMKQQPFIQDNRVLVPLNSLLQVFGFYIEENSGDNTVLKLDDYTIEFKNGDSSILVNGVRKTFDTAPVEKDNEVFVPIRLFSESLNYKVDWDENAQKVNVSHR